MCECECECEDTRCRGSGRFGRRPLQPECNGGGSHSHDRPRPPSPEHMHGPGKRPTLVRSAQTNGAHRLDNLTSSGRHLPYGTFSPWRPKGILSRTMHMAQGRPALMPHGTHNRELDSAGAGGAESKVAGNEAARKACPDPLPSPCRHPRMTLTRPRFLDDHPHQY